MKIFLTTLFIMILTSFAFSDVGLGAKKVKPQEDVTLTTGAKVANTGTKRGENITYSYTVVVIPETNETKDIGVIDFNDECPGTVTDFSSNEIINMNNSNAELVVVGTGGIINLGSSHYNINVTNNGKESITVNLPKGGTLTVGPDSHITLVG